MKRMFRAVSFALCGLLAVAPAAQADECAYNPERTKVLGGFDAKKGDYPFQVFISIGGEPVCGGTLIAPDAVLTAMHCVVDRYGEIHAKGDIFLRIGSIDAYQGGEVYDPEAGTGVTAILLPPGYDRKSLRHDLAILKLPKRSKIPPVPVEGLTAPAMPDAGGANAIVLGWGRISNSDSVSIPSILRYAFVPVVAPGGCVFPPAAAAKLEKYGAIDAKRICAGGVEGIDTCKGDSGGPLLIRGADGGTVQIGLTSYGPGVCGMKDSYGVYTRIGAFKPFLTQHVKFAKPVSGLVAENADVQNVSPGPRPVLVAEMAARAGSDAAPDGLAPVAVWVDGRSRFPLTRIPGVIAAPSEAAADFVWRPATGDVFRRAAGGALAAQRVGDIARLAGAIAKWRSVERLSALKGQDPAMLTISGGGGDAAARAFKDGETIAVTIRRPAAEALKYLTVVSFAGDGTVDFVFPATTMDSGELWDAKSTFSPKVKCPFGVDHMIAIATETPPRDLHKRLREIGALNYPSSPAATDALIAALRGKYAIAIKPVRTAP